MPVTTGCGSTGPASPSLSGPQPGVICYIDDHLGSSHLVTDSLGNIIREESRFPYGLERSSQPEPQSESAVAVDYVYTGKEYDTETGLIYFGGRYYAPELGRWLTPDPLFLEKEPAKIIENPLEGNIYSYVANNPMSYVDPSGLFKLPRHKDIIDNTIADNLSRAEYVQVLAGNVATDLFQKSNMHFDNSGFAATNKNIARLWTKINNSSSHIMKYDYFGQITHAVSDYYSHSTYVESFIAANPSATPSDISPAGNLDGSGLTSGSFSIVSMALGKDTHEVINKDSPGSLSGSKLSPTGYTYFEYAKSAAEKHTVELFNTFQDSLRK